MIKLTQGMKKKKMEGGAVYTPTAKSKALSKKIKTPHYDDFTKRFDANYKK